ncbi:MAG: Gfo/Idh/MocA family oxidoreductase [Bacteroidota bacterium]
MNTLRFGIIGLGLMGREFASAVARWCHLQTDSPVPVITAICNQGNKDDRDWFTFHFPDITLVTEHYQDLIDSAHVDAIYCAVPHHLHQQIYADIIRGGKHLLGEKPFGIDLEANRAILEEAGKKPGLIVRCSSEFPYYPGAKRVIDWLRSADYGRLMEVRCGFHHSSDMDLEKPVNWKRMVEINGEYGCMGDLGMHTQHIPFRMGWKPLWVFADLQKFAETRPDGRGNTVPCHTFDNAVLTTRAIDPLSKKEFSMVFETKRMAPGQTNTWFIEVYATRGSVKFSTRNPRSFYQLDTQGKEQGWTRTDIGSRSFVPGITGAIFETGFSDAFQQMIGAFMSEFRDAGSVHPFCNVLPEETRLSHRLMTGALESHRSGRRIALTNI